MTPWIRSVVLTRVLLALAVGSVGALPIETWAYQNHEDHEKQPTNLDEKVRALNFSPYEQLSADQRRLLQNYFEFIGAAPLRATEAELASTYTNWTVQRDWFAAEFLAMTHVMAQTYLSINGQDVLLISLVKELKEVKGDRLYTVLDPSQFELWLKGNQHFRFHFASGKEESGTMHMGGSQYGGSLHKGFDIQGFTSNTNLPRLQINYKRDGNLGDCDLDAFPPFFGGVIPNPKHLTYENSDSRYWLAKYTKKFGPPGFDIIALK